MRLDERTLLAFVHIEKCGGTTLIDALRRTFVLNHVDAIPRDSDAMLFRASDLRHLLRLRPRLASLSGHSIRIQSGLEEAFPKVAYFTCLRDPIRRYLSEYYYFVEKLGMPADFNRWLDRTDRHDFQTRSIAGVQDIGAARRILDERFAMVGVLEEFDEFFGRLRATVLGTTGAALLPIRGILNTRGGRSALPSQEELLDRFGNLIEDANRLDLQLYRHAKEITIPRQSEETGPALRDQARWTDETGCVSWLADYASLVLYRSYRNLVYKPYVNRWPGPHHLPAYSPRRIGCPGRKREPSGKENRGTQ